MKTVNIEKASSPKDSVRAKYCDTFFSRMIGLMFSKELGESEGLVISEKSESKSATAIHMMFVNYDITVLWLDRNMIIVDKVLAKSWALMYAPKRPAQYVVELHHSTYSEYAIGEKLTFEFK